MIANTSLIAELEEALENGSPEKRLETLRRVTNLFLEESDRLNDHQIGVFDDVLGHLVQRIESKALVQLSKSLAPVGNAPLEVVRRLARDDEIDVAGPVLAQSSRLDDSDLIEVASLKSQGHLLAISGRSSLSEGVTDVLVDRGDNTVVHRLAENSGARFSEFGFSTIVKRAGSDDSLAEKLGLRLDIPIKLLKQLLLQATDLVRSRLLGSASPETREQIQQALAGIAAEVAREASGPRNFDHAENLVQQLNRNGKLNERALSEFIKARQYEEMTATLALFCQAPVGFIERVIKTVQPEALLTTCKAAKLSWITVSEILRMRFAHHSISEAELDSAKKTFLTLSQAVAQRTLRFMLAQSAAKSGITEPKAAS